MKYSDQLRLFTVILTAGCLATNVAPAIAQQEKSDRCRSAEAAYRGALIAIMHDRASLLSVLMDSNAGKRSASESAFVEARFNSKISDHIAGINALLSWMQLERCPAPTPIPDLNRSHRVSRACFGQSVFECPAAKSEEEAIQQGR